MKKIFVLIGVIALFGLGTFVVPSCSKDDSSTSKNSCTCTSDGETHTVSLPYSTATTCGELEAILKYENGNGTCK